MNPDPLQLTRDELDWHNRKTCREGASYGIDPAKDHDGEPAPPPEALTLAWRLLEKDALPCLCGGRAGFHAAAANDPGDQSHIFCQNKRCGRIIPCGVRTIADGIEEWNRECCGEKANVCMSEGADK